MITSTKSYKTTDDQVFGSVPEAQFHELELLLGQSKKHNPTEVSEFVKVIMDKKDTIIDILTTGANSRPKARAIHGGTKKRNKPVSKLDAPVVSTPATNPTPVTTTTPV